MQSRDAHLKNLNFLLLKHNMIIHTQEWSMKCSDVGLVMGEVWLPGHHGHSDEWSCKVCGCMGKSSF